jgi:hypothetical protein
MGGDHQPEQHSRPQPSDSGFRCHRHRPPQARGDRPNVPRHRAQRCRGDGASKCADPRSAGACPSSRRKRGEGGRERGRHAQRQPRRRRKHYVARGRGYAHRPQPPHRSPQAVHCSDRPQFELTPRIRYQSRRSASPTRRLAGPGNHDPGSLESVRATDDSGRDLHTIPSR